MPQTRRIQKKTFVNKGATYGELLTEGLDKVLEQIDPLGKDDIFLDVGSGKGKLVARIADVTDVGRSIGVEFVEDRHKEAVEKFGEKEGVEFYFGNVLKTDYIEQADFIVMNSLAFPRETTTQVLNRIKKGSTILFNGWYQLIPLVCETEEVKKVFIPTSWYKRSMWYLCKKK